MNLHLVVHTENSQKLRSIFQSISLNPGRHNVSLHLHCKGYIPWKEPDLNDQIITFKTYTAFPTEKSKIASAVELISNIKDGRVILIDEDNYSNIPLELWDESNLDSLCSEVGDLIHLNLDTKYKTLKWFIADLFSQRLKKKLEITDDTDDFGRYSKKIESPLFYDKIIYIDGGMGDHIMSLPLMEKISEDHHICCKYPFIYDHLKFKSHIYWYDELFGGYDRFVYSYGSSNNSKTIVDAFFEMYGYHREESDVMRYNGRRESNSEIPTDKKIALICTSAAKINGIESNKNWGINKWISLSEKLIQNGYYVIQVGSKNDVEISNAHLTFFEKPLANLASLIEVSDLWISVDTFFHHFASAIKPNIGVCLTPFYNDHAKHPEVKYIEKDCGKNYWDRRWWLDSQQPERKECMNLIGVKDVLDVIGINPLDLIGAYYSANENNIHLLEFSVTNTRDFAKSVFVNFEGDMTDDSLSVLEKLKSKNLIRDYEFNGSLNVDLFSSHGCDFYIKLDADNLVEKKDIESAISEIGENDFAAFKVVRYFKNLNHVMVSESADPYSPVVFKTSYNRGHDIFPAKIKILEELRLHDLSFTYKEGKSPEFQEFFKTFYYYPEREVFYKGIEYRIERNEIDDLDIKGLIKVICSSNGPNDNCSNWRIFQPLDRFENGINYDIDFDNNFNHVNIRKADIFIINRPVIHFYDLLKQIQGMGVKVMVCYDDALPITEYTLPQNLYLESYLDILKILHDGCDMIATTCDPLKYYFQVHSGARISVFRNIVKPDLMTRKIEKNDGMIHIGWYGSTGHLRSLKIMSDSVLKILNEFPNVCFDLYADDMKLLPLHQRKEGSISDLFNHERIIFHSYNYNFYEFQKGLDSIDINLAPLEETHINLCKSDIRIQLAAYKGIPSIVTNFGEYKRFANLNGGALVCEDNEWYDKIKLLIMDKQKRDELGLKAKETIEKYYNYRESTQQIDAEIKRLAYGDKKIDHFYHTIGEDWFGHGEFYSEIVNRFPSGSRFAEVGVWKGRGASYMAVEIFNSGKEISFDCIDTFLGSEEHVNPDSEFFNGDLLKDNDWLYKEFTKNTAPVKDIVNPIRAISWEAADLYDDESLDFVFIDAAHDYESVKKDIAAWYPKVKVGGILAGHDYEYHEVNKAVHEFFRPDQITSKQYCWIHEKTKDEPGEYTVIDTFIFGGELDMLEMRLDYLYDSVDHFIIAESDKTHSGLERELVYPKNRDRFAKYSDKIHYIVFRPDISKMKFEVDFNDLPGSDFWRLEKGQRECMREKIIELSDHNTLILHGDLDEIPNKNKFNESWALLEKIGKCVIAIEQDLYYYSPLNLADEKWAGTVAFNLETLLDTPNFYSLRDCRHYCTVRIKNGGYHFSYFITPEKIRNKIKATAHQEFNTENNSSLDSIKERMNLGIDIFGRGEIKIKKLDTIKDDFPLEFYDHDVFLMNLPNPEIQ